MTEPMSDDDLARLRVYAAMHPETAPLLGVHVRRLLARLDIADGRTPESYATSEERLTDSALEASLAKACGLLQDIVVAIVRRKKPCFDPDCDVLWRHVVWVHKRSGKRYGIQCVSFRESDMQPLVTYGNKVLFTRPLHEFLDRFEVEVTEQKGPTDADDQ